MEKAMRTPEEAGDGDPITLQTGIDPRVIEDLITNWLNK